MMSYKEYKDAYEMLEAFDFDHTKEYTRFNKNGSWESMYFNPNGAQGEGQICRCEWNLPRGFRCL